MAPNGTAGPAWLRSAVFLGVPSLIAMFLVYALTTSVIGRVQAIERQQQIEMQMLELMKTGIENRQKDADETRRHFDAGVQRIENLLRAMCVAVAETPEKRNRCTLASDLVK